MKVDYTIDVAMTHPECRVLVLIEWNGKLECEECVSALCHVFFNVHQLIDDGTLLNDRE